ncbi:hypothetical protein BE08_20455 [Sorangium cellulosum]|uniref:Uncharacterized protein n=1 Tax=Sorangium cellulosum TaxID=56 RepID=A0A150PPV7_SORCE|nr:hypothetical protein BE08_20455 [Sorangium cellulosum]
MQKLPHSLQSIWCRRWRVWFIPPWFQRLQPLELLVDRRRRPCIILLFEDRYVIGPEHALQALFAAK